ncbi:MAG: thiamine phosphate synthase [Hyphomicrobiales bacterium]|nr:MAG: thiamine phosphate synthase [Hyphomicrobiales bacterium]
MRDNLIKHIKTLNNGILYVAINNDYSNQNIRHKSLAVANAVAMGGCDILQYRARNISYHKMLDEAKSIGRVCAENNIPFIINNHIDLALDVQADGVHLSLQDVSVKHTRAILGADKLIGLTVRSVSDAQNIEITTLGMLDYISIANVFATESDQTSLPPIGLKKLANMVEIIKEKAPDLTIVAIGGINEINMLQVLACGVKAVSVIGAISQAQKPAATCKRLKKIILKTLKAKPLNAHGA